MGQRKRSVGEVEKERQREKNECVYATSISAWTAWCHLYLHVRLQIV